MKKRLSSCLGSLTFIIFLLILLFKYGGVIVESVLNALKGLFDEGIDAIIEFAKHHPFIFLIILLLVFFGAKKRK